LELFFEDFANGDPLEEALDASLPFAQQVLDYLNRARPVDRTKRLGFSSNRRNNRIEARKQASKKGAESSNNIWEITGDDPDDRIGCRPQSGLHAGERPETWELIDHLT
jgi:hypothetical protein